MSSANSSLLPTHNAPLRVAIIAENFLPKIDGSTITLAHLLTHLQSAGVRAMLFGPESGMPEYAGARLFGTFGVPLKVYPGLKINFISPTFLAALRAFAPHVIHLVDPIWLGVQTLSAIRVLFPTTPIVTSHHTNLPTYAAIFGYPYWHHRTWALHQWFHSFAEHVLVPSASTAALLSGKGWERLRVCSRGVDRGAFSPDYRSPALRASWGASPSDVVIICIGRLSPEKNLALLVAAFAALPPNARRHAKLVFVGDGPFRIQLQSLCKEVQVNAVFTGQLTGRALGEAFASADVMCAPSITETFGQVTLQAMASGLPVVGFFVEGTADLVVHPCASGKAGAGEETGLLIDVHAQSVGRAVEREKERKARESACAGDWWGWGGVSTVATQPESIPSSAFPTLTRTTSSTSTDTVVSEDKDEDEDDIFDPLAPLSSPRLASHRSCHAMMEPTHPAYSEIVRRYAACMGVLVWDEGSSSSSSSSSTAPPLCPSSSPSMPAIMPDDGSESDEETVIASPVLRPKAKGEAAPPRVSLSLMEDLVLPSASIPPPPPPPPPAEGLPLPLRRAAARRTAMGARAKDKAEAYRWERCAGRILETYVDAVQGAPAGGREYDYGGEFSALGDVSVPVLAAEEEEERDPKKTRLPLPNATSPLLDSKLRPGFAPPPDQGGIWKTVTETVQPLVDAAVVVHALTAATLSHAVYMVPAPADLWAGSSA